MQTIPPGRVRVASAQSVIAAGVLATIAVTIVSLILVQKWFLPEPRTFASYKRQLIERHLDAQVLILGSSQALHGIIPHALDHHAVSLANGAQDLYYCCALARRYVPEMPKLKCIVLEVSVWGWQVLIARAGQAWRVPAYYFSFDIPPPHWHFGLVTRLAGFVVRNALYGQLDRDPFDEDGFLAVDGKLNRKIAKGLAEDHRGRTREAYAQMNLADVMKLIGECKSRGIKVVLVRLPTHQCYREELGQASLNRLQGMTEVLRGRTGVRYLDYFRDDRFGDEDFTDGLHLNVRGAAASTEILARDLAAGE
jgi:hypothetical protein